MISPRIVGPISNSPPTRSGRGSLARRRARRDPDSPLVFHRDDIPVRRAIQQADATLWYLPPYSPDLNPSERCFAKLKAIVRAARCRSIDRLWPFLGECLQRFSPAECRN